MKEMDTMSFCTTKKQGWGGRPRSGQEISTPRTLVAYHTPNPLTIAKIMAMTMVSAGWRSGCAIILMYIASPSIRERRTNIIGKLYFFCVMLFSHFDIYADFKELGICSCSRGYDVNLFHPQAGEKGTPLPPHHFYPQPPETILQN